MSGNLFPGSWDWDVDIFGGQRHYSADKSFMTSEFHFQIVKEELQISCSKKGTSSRVLFPPLFSAVLENLCLLLEAEKRDFQSQLYHSLAM